VIFMNNYDVIQSLNYVVTLLAPITQLNLIEYNEKESTSWRNRQPGIYNNIYYPLEYQKLVDNHQYSIILKDGSFFQFYYFFNKKELISAKLAFYPVPIGCESNIEELLNVADTALEREDDSLFQHLYNWNDLLTVSGHYPINTSHIRFDYDPRATTHEPSHLQFGGVNNLRLAADFFPLPYAFVQLVSDLLDGCEQSVVQHLNHAKNKKLPLNATEKIISIRST